MIATRRGLVIAGALALVLLAITLVDATRSTVVVDRALVPGFDAAKLTALVWRGDSTGSSVAQTALDQRAGRWQWRADGAPVDAAALDAVLSALRGARWQRRDDVRGDKLLASLDVVSGDRTTRLELSTPLAGGGQTWLERGDDRLLVDDWVARALFPEPLALRVRRPLADAASAKRIVIERPGTTYRLEGSPRELVKPAHLLLAPEVAAAVEQALGELELVALAPVATSPVEWTITIDAPALVTVELRGPCAGTGQVAISGTAGTGCVAAAAVTRLVGALQVLADPPNAVDHRLLPLAITALRFPHGERLALSARPRLGDRDADPTKVAELLATLAAPGEVVPRSQLHRIVFTARDAAGRDLAIEDTGDGFARTDEPVAIRLGEGARTILLRPPADYIDPTLWTEEPTTIGAIAIDGTTYSRGVVVGEWTRTGPGADAPGVVEQLAAALATPRSVGSHTFATLPHTVTLTIAPPTSAARMRTLELGTTPQGCAAIIDGAKHLVDKQLCALVTRLRQGA